MYIKDIAKIANVSVSTVSKIINNKVSDINPKTVERVLAIVKEYNYVPYANVLKNKTAKQFSIALLLPEKAGSSAFQNGVFSMAEENRYHISVFFSNYDEEKENKNISYITSHDFDGLIWSPVSEESLKQRTQFETAGIPFVICFDTKVTKSYYIDFRTIYYRLAEYLLSKNHKRICLVTDMKRSKTSKRCEHGFQNCMLDNNIHFTSDMIVDVDDPDFSDIVLKQDVTGIICTDANCAFKAAAALKTIGKSIPQDISLVSAVDSNSDFIDFFPFTAITVPYHEFGAFICNKLIGRLENQSNQGRGDFKTVTQFFDRRTVKDMDTASTHILVIGSINIDLLMSVDSLPMPGQTNMCNMVTSLIGGKAANQATGICKLGGDARIIGKVGKDFPSTYVYSFLNENHVDIDGVSQDMNSDTGKAYICYTKNGDSMITILPGANALLTEEDILSHEDYFENASYVLVQSEIPINIVKLALKLAKKHDVPTIFKPAAINSLDEDIFSYVDIFIPNRKEAEKLYPLGKTTAEEMASYFQSLGAKTVIITLNSDGAYILDRQKKGYHIPAITVMDIVDATGGSDAFIAAMTNYLVKGYDLEDAARIGSYAANICISRLGVSSSLADQITLETLINKHEPELLK